MPDTCIKKIILAIFVALFAFQACMAGNYQPSDSVNIDARFELLKEEFIRLNSVLEQDISKLKDSIRLLNSQLEDY